MYTQTKLKVYRWKFVNFFVIILLCVLESQSILHANSQGLDLYSKGNFQGAIQAYNKELASAKSADTKANIYKMIGICQFNMGQKDAARQSFENAKSLNPSERISKSEVLDEAVIPFFNGVKAEPAKKTTTRVETPQPSQKLAPNAQSAKSTKILITSNAPNATVSIDGIMAGQTGSEIEADPGNVQISLSAKGYKSAVANATIKPGQTNALEINLKKIEPPKPKKVVAAKPKPKPKPIAQKPKKGMFDDEPKVNPSRDITKEFANDGVPQPTPQPVQQPVYQPAPQPIQQPVYQPAPQPVQQPAPQPVQQPVYQPAPQPVQQPVYQPAPQPVYQQPQPAPQPAPVYQPQPQPQYPTPPPAQIYEEPEFETVKKKRSKPNRFISILPLGAGQFQNDNPLLGTGFAIGQIGCLVYWYMNYQDAEKTVKDTDAYTESRLAEEKTISNNSELVAHQQATDDYVEKSNKYVKSTQQKAMFGLIGAGGLWALGIVEAIVNEPVYKAPKKKKKKRGPFANNDFDFDTEYYNLYNGHAIALEKHKIDFDYQVAPFNYLNPRDHTGLLLQIQVRY